MTNTPKKTNTGSSKASGKPDSGKTTAKRAPRKPAKTNEPKAKASGSTRRGPYKYDVCFSFAGENRRYVDKVAEHLKKLDPKMRLFYDFYEEDDLWGKDLPTHFDEIYQYKSRYCVMFISEHYAKKEWTNLERRSALARTLTNKGKEYILPAYFDGTTLLGVPRSVGMIDLTKLTPLAFAKRIIGKLRPKTTSDKAASGGTSSSIKVPRLAKPKTEVLKTPSEKRGEVSYGYKVTSSGAWMLLGDTFYITKKVEDVDGKIQVQLVPRSTDEMASLNDLDPKRGNHHHSRVAYAHAEDGALVDVESVKVTSTAGKRQVTLLLRPTSGGLSGNVPWSDEVAKEQVKALLLSPDKDDGASSSSASSLYNYGSRTKKSVLPVLWKRMRGQSLPTADVLRCARLQAIFQLKTEGAVEHVLELTLGSIKNGVVTVHFRGRRANSNSYAGNSPSAFTVSGTCDLAVT